MTARDAGTDATTSDGLSLEALTQEIERLRCRAEQLHKSLERRESAFSVVRRIAQEINATLVLDAVLSAILSSMQDVFGFEHSMVLLLEPDGETLKVVASLGYAERGIGAEVKMGQGVIGVVAKRKRMMRMGAVTQQQAYAQSVRVRMQLLGQAQGIKEQVPLPGLPNVQSTVAIPMLIEDDLVGVFAVESAARVSFDEHDEQLIMTVASQAATAIQNARLYELLARRNDELVALNQSSSRFVPHEFLYLLGRKSLTDVARGDHVQKEMSIMFSDIRSFTTLIEGKTPKENFAFINEYLAYMAPKIGAHGGFIDSYEGDLIMALFEGGADDAVRAAIANLEALKCYNQLRAKSARQPIAIGIGVNTGTLMLGTIGSKERLKCGVIGDPVNLASRLESATKNYGASLLITEHTRDRLENRGEYAMRVIDRICVKGKTQPVTVYEVLDGLPESERSSKLASAESFERGFRYFQGGDMLAAASEFRAIVGEYPGDRAAELYVERCDHYLAHGMPEPWDGVVTLQSK